MVRPGRSVVLLAALTLPLALTLSAKELGEYKIGDRLEADLIAPSQMTVVDADATDALKEKEAQRVPVVVRFYTNAVVDAEARFRDSFDRTRNNFLDAVEKSFGMRKISADDIASEKFQLLVASFQKRNKLMPVDAAHAAVWASGDADAGYEQSLAAAIRSAMAMPIRGAAPPEVKIGSTVRLVSLGSPTDGLNADAVAQRGSNVPRANTISIMIARSNLLASLPQDEAIAGKYAGSFLETNAAVDVALTQELRARHTEKLSVTENFEAGQVIAHRGQVVDKKIKAALDQVKEKSAAIQAQQLLVTEKAKTAQAQERIRWLAGTLIGAIVILVPTIWLLARRKQTISLLPAVAKDAVDWRERALVAEEQTRKTQEAARSGLISQMAFWLSNKFTERLISQQNVLLEAQNKAAAEMVELEARLEKIQAPLHDRLTAYERRIAELEKDLAVKGEENRELIRTKIDVVRKQLETKRGIYQVIVNPGTPRAWELRLKAGVNTFGRSPANDFRIDDPSVSVFHCEIVCDEEGATVRDLKSTNGTHVANTRIQSSALRPGQTFQLGSVEMLFAGKPATLPFLAVTQPLAFFPARN